MQVKFRINIFLIGVLVIGLVSCQKELTLEEYSAYISNPDNGLRINQTVSGFELSAMYEPANYFSARQNSDLTVEEASAYEHIQFRIKLLQGGNILLYKETQHQNEVTRINHFGFMAQDDFVIYTGSDTNRCKMVHFSRNYNLSPTVDLSLAFDAIPKTNDWQLVYNDKQFNLGRVKFLFKSEDLTDIPALKR